MLADAIDKRLVHVVHGSMRIRVHLRPGGAGDDLTFWGLVVPWELGYLPLHRGRCDRAWPRSRGADAAEWFEWGDAHARRAAARSSSACSGRLGTGRRRRGRFVASRHRVTAWPDPSRSS